MSDHKSEKERKKNVKFSSTRCIKKCGSSLSYFTTIIILVPFIITIFLLAKRREKNRTEDKKESEPLNAIHAMSFCFLEKNPK
jgi:hypothetical protein